jgi:hypothetical protein
MTGGAEQRRLELTDELPHWKVMLMTGDVIIVAAHGYGEEQGEYVFSALMVGTPHFEVHLARFPRTAVRRILSA